MAESKSAPITAEMYDYILAHNPPLDAVQRDIVEITRQQFPEAAGMQSAEEQGPLLAFLVRLIGARHVVEVGTFTGFSALSMAQALPADGTLIACDVSEEWTAYGREAWAKAGVGDRIQLRIAPALETLRAMPAGPHRSRLSRRGQGRLYRLLGRAGAPAAAGGLIVADNVLYHGEVADPSATGNALAIRAFNDHVVEDHRMEAVILTVADGVTLARKR